MDQIERRESLRRIRDGRRRVKWCEELEWGKCSIYRFKEGEERAMGMACPRCQSGGKMLEGTKGMAWLEEMLGHYV